MVLRPTAPAHASHPPIRVYGKKRRHGHPTEPKRVNNRIFLGSTPIYIPSTKKNRLECQGNATKGSVGGNKGKTMAKIVGRCREGVKRAVKLGHP